MTERCADALRRVHDAFTLSGASHAELTAVASSLVAVAEVLERVQVTERDRLPGHLHEFEGRGQVLAPVLHDVDESADDLWARVCLGNRYLGGNRAAHGGALSLLFDEAMGRLANHGGRPRARTAYLHVNYRVITLVGEWHELVLRVRSVEGRKCVVTAELIDGDGVVVADAEGLFVTLRPGQP